MSEQAIPYRVTILREGQVVVSRSFDSNVITIGRLPDCELQIDDSGISRKHAELLRTSQGFALYAHETGNVTHVRGELVAPGATVTIAPGDPVRLARSFELRLEVAQEGGAPQGQRRPSRARRPSRVAPMQQRPPIRPGPSGERPPGRSPTRPVPTLRRTTPAEAPQRPPPRQRPSGVREQPPRQTTGRRRNLPPRPGTMTPLPPGAAPPAGPQARRPSGNFIAPPPAARTPRPPGVPLPDVPITPIPPKTALSARSRAITPRPPGAPIAPPVEQPAPAEAPEPPEAPEASQARESSENAGGLATLSALGATHGAPVPIPPPVQVEIIPSARRRDGQARAWLVCQVNGSEQALGVHDDFYIGGGEDSDLRLNGAYAPRRAALVVFVEGEHRLYNTSPLPETVLVNGRGIQGFTVLFDGDQVQVYGATLSFEKNPGLIP